MSSWEEIGLIGSSLRHAALLFQGFFTFSAFLFHRFLGAEGLSMVYPGLPYIFLPYPPELLESHHLLMEQDKEMNKVDKLSFHPHMMTYERNELHVILDSNNDLKNK